MCASESLKGRRPWPWRTSGVSAERSRLCAFIKGRLFVTLLLSAAVGPFYLLRLCVDFFSLLLIAVKKRPLSRKNTINTIDTMGLSTFLSFVRLFLSFFCDLKSTFFCGCRNSYPSFVPKRVFLVIYSTTHGREGREDCSLLHDNNFNVENSGGR